MRMQVISGIRILPLMLFAAWTTACVTSGKEGASDAAETGDPALEGDDNVPTPRNTTLPPGVIDDIDLKELVYQGAEKQLAANDDDQTRVEIGDFESFKFSITKMTKSGEDVTNLQSEQPDRLIVEMHGWYKRTGKAGEEPSENCFSFESTVSLVAEADSWTYDDKDPLKFNRESSEDCY